MPKFHYNLLLVCIQCDCGKPPALYAATGLHERYTQGEQASHCFYEPYMCPLLVCALIAERCVKPENV